MKYSDLCKYTLNKNKYIELYNTWMDIFYSYNVTIILILSRV
jgi:hypothetical protein